MDPTVLAWALAQPAGTRAAVLAAAVTGGPLVTGGNAPAVRHGRSGRRKRSERVEVSSPRSA